MEMTIGIVTAIIGLLGAYFAGVRNRSNEFVLKDREKWRNYLRTWSVTFNEINYHDFDKFKKLSQHKESLRNRVNLYKDYTIIEFMTKLEKSKSEVEYNKLKSVINFYISSILKYEWERVKKDSKVLPNIFYFDFFMIFQSLFYIFSILLTVDIYVWNLKVLLLVLFPIILYIIIKIIFVFMVRGLKLKSFIKQNYLKGINLDVKYFLSEDTEYDFHIYINKKGINYLENYENRESKYTSYLEFVILISSLLIILIIFREVLL